MLKQTKKLKNPRCFASLRAYRQKIDKTDRKIAKLLRERKKTVKQIRKLKLKNNMQLSDKRREKEILKKLKTPYEKAIFKEILKQSKKRHSKS